ncbi:hypothetical protein CTZ24_24210 (plasmid) [Pantoea phytobeneficialis]|uniref:DUF1254 domain-containing protein n=2 Tax=Pantoea phytobeneficialis TaxID=2052056 RepID=A0AAP9HAL0_9GAMM|nr:DUF1254 domain-containing protein [Pantoea phytobeneficialis]MDO6406477.1 DUF1254 domain-containing protein [Pantoea phytobeneficialis]QGR09574.1 hypothetical protein CTZ24_24210 [Pantoea phytobeneficialis]
MKLRPLALNLALGGMLSTFITTPVFSADAPPQSPLMAQINNGNWLPQNDAQSLSDELYYQDAIHAYITTLPLLNTIGLRDGSEAAFGKGYNILPIWKQRMDSRAVVPTPNGDVIYSMSYLDLKETGPLVVKAPHDVIGMFTDFFQHTITDVGAVGPDRARGGLYLLLPPDYEGPVPQGYFAFKSPTYNVFLFFRTVMAKGEGKPDPAPAVKNAETTRVYPLWDVEKDVKPMQFPDASGKRVNMMYPVDASYWTKLKAFVDYEPLTAIPDATRSALLSIGMVKGKPFNPSPKQTELLNKAVEMAPKMIFARRQLGREDQRQLYYKDRHWENSWAGATAEWMQFGTLDENQRAAFFQIAYSSAAAMVMHTTGAGSKYPFTTHDKEGNFLEGGNTYKLHLPPNPPAALFWAVTAYNVTDGTMPETDQLLPSTNGYYDLPKNQDGSIDIWFGPAKPDGVADNAFIKTIKGRNFLVALRLYGTEDGFYDQTWVPDDLIKTSH